MKNDKMERHLSDSMKHMMAEPKKKTICPLCRHYASTIYIDRYNGKILGCRDCVEAVDVECYLRHVGGGDD